jgi:hypothetical protein
MAAAAVDAAMGNGYHYDACCNCCPVEERVVEKVVEVERLVDKPYTCGASNPGLI